MNSITKNKSLVSIIIFLLITNIAMLIFFLVLNKPSEKNAHGRDQNGMSVMLQKEVDFKQNQIDKYLSLRKEQLDTLHALFDDLRKAKMNFYNLIYTPEVNDSTVQMAADVIAQKQKTLDLHMFNHFKTVRSLCTPDQLQKFDSSIKKVFIRMTARVGRDGRDPNK